MKYLFIILIQQIYRIDDIKPLLGNTVNINNNNLSIDYVDETVFENGLLVETNYLILLYVFFKPPNTRYLYLFHSMFYRQSNDKVCSVTWRPFNNTNQPISTGTACHFTGKQNYY